MKPKLKLYEYLKLMVCPWLNFHDPFLRQMVIEASLLIIDLDCLDLLIASFFYNYTLGSYTTMCFIAESISLFVFEHNEAIKKDNRLKQRV